MWADREEIEARSVKKQSPHRSRCGLLLINPLEAKHNATRVAQIILPAVAAGRQAVSQRFGRAELGSQPVQLSDSNGNVLRQTKVNSPAECHGKGIGAADIGVDPAENRHAHAGAQPRHRLAEQSMTEYPDAAEIRANRRAEQEVVHGLGRARREAEGRKAYRRAVIAVEVGCQTEMRRKVEGGLSIPTIEVIAAVIQESQAAIAGTVAAAKVGISPEQYDLRSARFLGKEHGR